MSDEAGTHTNYETQWTIPVTAEAKNTSIITVTGPTEAYEFLMSSWPSPHGAAYSKAKRAVMGAIAGKVDHEDARSAFVSACLAAGCLVGHESS